MPRVPVCSPSGTSGLCNRRPLPAVTYGLARPLRHVAKARFGAQYGHARLQRPLSKVLGASLRWSDTGPLPTKPTHTGYVVVCKAVLANGNETFKKSREISRANVAQKGRRGLKGPVRQKTTRRSSFDSQPPETSPGR